MERTQTYATRGAGRLLIALLFGGLAATLPAYAETFVSGSTGVDGAFAPTCAPTPCQVTVGLPANGVFNFTTVNIPAGVTVRFNRNALNTPVFILATGDVTIDGTVDLSGASAPPADTVSAGGAPGAAGGPGGFDGGSGAIIHNGTGGPGLGPGGGAPGTLVNTSCCGEIGTGGGGGGGGFGSGGRSGDTGGPGGVTYGTEHLIPLVGGSGGGGGGATIVRSAAGGGGGGAILVASSGTLKMTGQIVASGGAGGKHEPLPSGALRPGCGGGGSGGAIRVIATTIAGDLRNLIAAGGPVTGSTACVSGGNGGAGRIRVEFFKEVLTYLNIAGSQGRPGPVFVPRTPSLRFTSVAGSPAPATPSGSLAAPDITLSSTTTNPVTVNLSASNIPLGTAISVTVIPKSGNRTGFASTPLAGTEASSTATADVTLPVGMPAVLMAQAEFTVQQLAALDLPTLKGEKLAKVEVEATMGGESRLVYITKSGKRIPANEIGPLLYAKLEGSGVKK